MRDEFMWDTIFCLLFVVLLLFWLVGRGASSNENNAHFSYSSASTVSHESEGNHQHLSLDPTDISEPANMAMWMELGEL